MVETTIKKAQQLIKTLLSEGHIDKTTAKWLSLAPDSPQIPVFYTLTKIHKLTPHGWRTYYIRVFRTYRMDLSIS